MISLNKINYKEAKELEKILADQFTSSNSIAQKKWKRDPNERFHFFEQHLNMHNI